MCRRRGPLNERWVVGVDVCGLDVNEALSVVRGRTKTFAEQLRHDLN